MGHIEEMILSLQQAPYQCLDVHDRLSQVIKVLL